MKRLSRNRLFGSRLFAVAAGLMFGLLTLVPLRAQSPEVQELYQRARAAQQAGDTEKAIAAYRELLKKDPSLPAAYNNLGRLYFSLDRYQEAAEVLQKGLSIKADMAPAQIMLGSSYFQLGQAAKAVAPLQAGVKAMPADQSARMTLARVLTQLNRNEEAMAQLQKLVQLDPKDQRSWYLLGKLQLQMSQDSFAHVRAINVDSPLSHQLSGEIMESMKNYPGAIAEYKHALTVDPNDLQALLHLADIYWSTANWSAARPTFVNYLEKKPSDCMARWKLANTLNQLDVDPAEVIEQASKAVQLCPDLYHAQVDRARALIKQDKLAEALADLKSAEAKGPEEPTTQFLLGKVYKSLGDSAHAETANVRFKQMLKAQQDAEQTHREDVVHANEN